jgi:hypothetical protein
MGFLPMPRQGCRVVRFVLAPFFTGWRPERIKIVDHIRTMVSLFAGAGRDEVNILVLGENIVKGYNYWIAKWIPRFFF